MSADGSQEGGAARRTMSGEAYARYWMENPKAMPPSSRLLGCRPVVADPERGFCRNSFENRPEFRNPNGALQGGLIAAMLDDTMAVGALFKIGGGFIVPTLEMKVNYTRPVITDQVFAEGWLRHSGRTIAFLEGQLLNADEEVCATATAIIREFRKTRA